jgi:benzoate transport
MSELVPSTSTQEYIEETTVEKLHSRHWKSLWASTIGYAMDGLDLMILSFVLPLIIAGLGISAVQAGSIATVTLIGAVSGGILFGILADIFGRVKILTITILIFSIFTGLSAFAPDLFWLEVTRFFAGLGLGGEFGIGMTLVTESWPKKYRSRATAGVAVGFQFGVLLAILFSMIITPYFGWRGVFIVGMLPAVVAWWMRRSLDEPELWKQQHQKRSKGQHAALTISALFNSPRRITTTIGLIIASTVQNCGYYGIMTWLPTMLAKELGFSFNKSGLWTISTIIGMIIGIMVFGYLVDKLGRKPSYIMFQLLSAVVIWVFFQQSDSIMLLILGAIMGFFVNGMLGGYGALLAEHYPTEARSTAENVIFNIGRGIGGFAPFVIGYLSTNHSLSWAMSWISATYVFAAICFFLFIPESKNKELE